MLIWLVPSPCHWEGSKKFYLSSPRKPRLQSQFLYCQRHKVALKIIFKISTILQLKIHDQTLPQNLDINSVPTSRQHFSFKVWTANLLQNLEKTSLLILTNIKIKLSTKHQIKISTKLSSKHSLPSTSRNLNHGKGGLTTKDCVAVVWSVIYDIFLNSHKRLIGWSAERTRVFLQQTTKPALNPTEGGLEYQQ